MMSNSNKPDAKGKRQHTLPNRQLAQAFQFSAQDLAANRAGYSTRAQEWGIPLRLRSIFSAIETSKLVRMLTFSRRQKVDTCSGRVRLFRELREIWSERRVDLHEIHYMTVYGYEMQFPLTQRQYQQVQEGIVYDVYYLCYTSTRYQVLSLERAI